MLLTIGCIPLMASYGIMQVVTDFKDENTNVEFNLIEYNNYTGKGMGDSLLNFEFDLGFCDPKTINSNRLETIKYAIDHLVAILPENHPLALHTTIDIKLFDNQKMLLMDSTTPFYSMCHSLFDAAGIKPNVVFYGIRIENFIEMASKNMGIAILMKKHTLNINKKDVVIREITPSATRTISLARVINRHHSAISEKFWNYIKDRHLFP
jgi:DNA-binding transcriptional LysR family regulator